MGAQDERVGEGEGEAPLLDIPRRCSVEWSSVMSGQGAARTCGRCQRVVHDLSVLSATQIRALMSDSSERICVRMDRNTARRLGAKQLKVFALSTMLVTAGVAVAGGQSDALSNSTSIRGVVRNGTRLLSNVEVRAKARRSQRAVTVTKTDERGAYTFEDLRPGSYVISFAGDSASQDAGPESWDVDVEVCKGITLVLDSSSPPQLIGEALVIRLKPGTIEGRVTSQKLDDGLSGAIVRLLRPSDGLRRTARTDAFGSYSFDGLEPGHYVLTGAAPGFSTRSRGLDLMATPPEQLLGHWENFGDITLCPREAEK